MRTRTTTVILATTAALLAGCGGPSYDEAAEQCMAAVKALPAGAQRDDKPKACERMTEKDYSMIFMSKIFDDKGWTDENGKPDLNRILQPTPNP
ncbi:hypothetical protein ACIQV3_22555 [Streptomyces sp. NPDC099050]|uniref:hypothetical protein n=1 Tax=Streptomyces sp. NPDC099050 TaxID=3366100 RepID=UPI00381FDA9A